MYSTARKIATASAIFCALNIFVGLIFILVTMSLNLAFPIRLSMIMYIVTVSLTTLMLTLSIRSICEDLQYEYENNIKKLHDMNDRLKDIEHCH